MKASELYNASLVGRFHRWAETVESGLRSVWDTSLAGRLNGSFGSAMHRAVKHAGITSLLQKKDSSAESAGVTKLLTASAGHWKLLAGVIGILICGLGWVVAGPIGAAAAIGGYGLAVGLGLRSPASLIGLTFLALALSPKFPQGETPFFLRIDDLFILALLVMALRRIQSGRSWKASGIETALLVWIAVTWLATGLASLTGRLPSELRSALYLLKQLEYLVAFFATWTLLQDDDQPTVAIPWLLAGWLGALAAILLLGVTSISWLITREAGPFWILAALCAASRTTQSRSIQIAWRWVWLTVLLTVSVGLGEYLFLATESPFRNPSRIFSNAVYLRESNHFGGFLAIVSAFLAARWARGETPWARATSGLLLVAVTITIALTFSRGALLGCAAGITASLLLARPYRLVAVAALLALVIAIAPDALERRIVRTGNEYEEWILSRGLLEAGYPPRFSYARNRFEVWEIAMREARAFPILGAGIGARHRVFYENIYIQIWSESGVLGALAFLWLILLLPRLGFAPRSSGIIRKCLNSS